MKLNWYCVVIVIAICCLNATADNDDDETNGCLERYLMRKGKLPSDHPAKAAGSTFICSFTTEITVTLLKSVFTTLIESSFQNGADCLKREFENNEITDLIMKLNLIEESQLGESEQKIQINQTRNELRQDLTKIAVQCETNEKKFVEIFNEQLGIKNETLSALEHNYCFAKYAAENELLPLKGVNLNPNDILTTYIDCEAIIRKERRKQEHDVRQAAKQNMGDSVNCAMNLYNEQNLFNTGIVSRVLEYVELPKETKDDETDKAAKKVVDFATALIMCALSN